MDNYTDLNAKTIDKWVGSGWERDIPVSPETCVSARRRNPGVLGGEDGEAMRSGRLARALTRCRTKSGTTYWTSAGKYCIISRITHR